jgi:hypothetical protein
MGSHNVNTNRVPKKFISILTDNFQEFETSVEEAIADLAERTRQLELEVEPKSVPELLYFYDKRMRSCFL